MDDPQSQIMENVEEETQHRDEIADAEIQPIKLSFSESVSEDFKSELAFKVEMEQATETKDVIYVETKTSLEELEESVELSRDHLEVCKSLPHNFEIIEHLESFPRGVKQQQAVVQLAAKQMQNHDEASEARLEEKHLPSCQDASESYKASKSVKQCDKKSLNLLEELVMSNDSPNGDLESSRSLQQHFETNDTHSGENKNAIDLESFGSPVDNWDCSKLVLVLENEAIPGSVEDHIKKSSQIEELENKTVEGEASKANQLPKCNGASTQNLQHEQISEQEDTLSGKSPIKTLKDEQLFETEDTHFGEHENAIDLASFGSPEDGCDHSKLVLVLENVEAIPGSVEDPTKQSSEINELENKMVAEDEASEANDFLNYDGASAQNLKYEQISEQEDILSGKTSTKTLKKTDSFDNTVSHYTSVHCSGNTESLRDDKNALDSSRLLFLLAADEIRNRVEISEERADLPLYHSGSGENSEAISLGDKQEQLYNNFSVERSISIIDVNDCVPTVILDDPKLVQDLESTESVELISGVSQCGTENGGKNIHDRDSTQKPQSSDGFEIEFRQKKHISVNRNLSVDSPKESRASIEHLAETKKYTLEEYVQLSSVSNSNLQQLDSPMSHKEEKKQVVEGSSPSSNLVAPKGSKETLDHRLDESVGLHFKEIKLLIQNFARNYENVRSLTAENDKELKTLKGECKTLEQGFKLRKIRKENFCNLLMSNLQSLEKSVLNKAAFPEMAFLRLPENEIDELQIVDEQAAFVLYHNWTLNHVLTSRETIISENLKLKSEMETFLIKQTNLRSKIETLQDTLIEKDLELENLQFDMCERSEEVEKLRATMNLNVDYKECEVDFKFKMEQKCKEIEKLQATLRAKDTELKNNSIEYEMDLKSEVGEIEKLYKMLKEDDLELENLHVSYKESEMDLKHEIEEKCKEIEAMQAMLEEKDLQLGKFRFEIGEKNKAIENLEATVKVKDVELKTLMNNFKNSEMDLKSKIEESSVKLEELQVLLDNKDLALENLQLEIGKLESTRLELEQLRPEIEEECKELEQLKVTLKEKEFELQKLQAEIKDEGKAITRFQELMKVADLELENLHIRYKESEIDFTCQIEQKSKELKKVQAILEGKELELENLQCEIEQMSKDLEELQTTLKGRDALLAKKQDEIEALKQLEDASKEKQVELENLCGSYEKSEMVLKSQVEEKCKEIVKVEAMLEGKDLLWQNSRSEIDKKDQALESLEAMVKVKDVQLENLGIDFKKCEIDLKLEIGEKVGKLEKLRELLKDKELELTNLQQQIVKLQGQLDAKDLEFKNLQPEIKGNNEKLEELQATLKQKCLEIENLQREIEKLKAGMKAKDFKLDEQQVEMEERVKELQVTFEGKDLELESLQCRIGRKDDEIEKLKENAKAKDLELDKLQAEIEKKSEEHKEVKKTLKEQQLELEKLHFSYEESEMDLKCQVEEKGKEIEKVESMLEGKDLQLESLKSEIGQQNEVIEHLEATLNAKDVEFKNLGNNFKNSEMSLKSEIQAKSEQIEELKLCLRQKTCELEHLGNTHMKSKLELETIIEEKTNEIQTLQAKLEVKGLELKDLLSGCGKIETELKSELEGKDKQIGRLELILTEKELKLEQAVSYKKCEIDLNSELKEKSKEIERLQESIKEKEVGLEKMNAKYQKCEMDFISWNDTLSALAKDVHRDTSENLCTNVSQNWYLRCKAIDEHVNLLQNRIASRDKSIIQLNETIDDVENKLQDEFIAKKDLLENLVQLSKRIDRSVGRASECASEIFTVLRSDVPLNSEAEYLEDGKKSLLSPQDENSDQSNPAAEITNNIKNLQKIDSLVRGIANLKTQIENIISENTALKREEAEKINILLNEKEHLTSDLESLQLKLAHANKYKLSLEIQLADKEKKIIQLESLTCDIEGLNAKIQELSHRNICLEEEIQEHVSKEQSLLADLEKMCLDIEDVEKAKMASEGELKIKEKDLIAVSDEKERLLCEVQNLQSRLQCMEKKHLISELKIQKAEEQLQKVNASVEDISCEKLQLEERIKNSKTHGELLLRAIQNIDSNADAEAITIYNLQLENENLHSINDNETFLRVADEIAKVKQNLITLKDEQNTSRDKMAHLESILNAAKLEKKNDIREMDKNRSTIEALLEKEFGNQCEIKSMCLKLEDLEEALREMTKAKTNLEIENTQWKSKGQQLQQEVTLLNEQMKANLNSSENAIEEAKDVSHLQNCENILHGAMKMLKYSKKFIIDVMDLNLSLLSYHGMQDDGEYRSVESNVLAVREYWKRDIHDMVEHHREPPRVLCLLRDFFKRENEKSKKIESSLCSFSKILNKSIQEMESFCKLEMSVHDVTTSGFTMVIASLDNKEHALANHHIAMQLEQAEKLLESSLRLLRKHQEDTRELKAPEKEKLQSEIFLLKRNLIRFEKQHHQLQTMCGERDEEIAKLEAKSTDAEATVCELNTKLADVAQKYEESQDDLCDTLIKMVAMKDELNEAKEMRSVMEENFWKAKRKLDELKQATDACSPQEDI